MMYSVVNVQFSPMAFDADDDDDDDGSHDHRG